MRSLDPTIARSDGLPPVAAPEAATAPTTGASPRIDAIQLLRGVAASLVVVDHALLSAVAPGSAMRPAIENAAYALGDLGVETFFAISGCLMAVTSAKLFGRPGGPGGFLRRRLLRIVPLYWLITAVALFFGLRKSMDIPLEQIVASFLFLPTWGHGADLKPVLSQGWTLNYEMFFYAIFAFALVFTRRLGWAVLILSFFALVLLGSVGKSLLDTAGPANVVQFWTDPIILTFLAGALVARVRPYLLKVVRTERPVLALCLIGLLIILATTWLVLDVDNVLPRPLWARWSMRFAAIATVLVCLLPHGAPTGVIGRIAYTMGNASFSTYLTHGFAVSWGLRALTRVGLENPFAKVAILVLLANVLGYIVHRCAEIPLLSLFGSEGHLLRVFRAART